ncbi:hypothetical protein ACLMJK_005931 [Lecanora helva]
MTALMSTATETEKSASPAMSPATDSEKSSLPTISTTSPETASPKSPKPSLPALKTPSTATLPSQLPKSPLPDRLELIKQEDEDMKTPITPPQAYTEFLRALSPALSTPSTGKSPIFDRTSGKSTPSSQPSSAASCTCNNHDSLKTQSAPMIPPSPFMRPPTSARTPTALKRLRIPQSPAWSPSTDSPRSSTLSSAKGSAMRSPFSPADWAIDGKTRHFEAPRSGTHKSVSVRQVVTRTVTYTRSPVTPLDPAPKGKKRRLE